MRSWRGALHGLPGRGEVGAGGGMGPGWNKKHISKRNFNLCTSIVGVTF